MCVHRRMFMGVIYYIFIDSTHFIPLFVDNQDVIYVEADYQQI